MAPFSSPLGCPTGCIIKPNDCDVNTAGTSVFLQVISECGVTEYNDNMDSSAESQFKQNFEQKLLEYEQQHQGSHRKPWTQDRIAEVIQVMKNGRIAMKTGERRKPMEYYWMNKYDVVTTANQDHLIFKRKTTEDPTVRIIPREKYFAVLTEIHKSCGHGGRDKMLYATKTKLYIPKKAIEVYISLCPICEAKRNAPKKNTVTRDSHDFNIVGHVDLIDLQSCPDGDYKWLLNYQDYATKFTSLRPLRTNSTSEVALELMKIFLAFGAPCVLQSSNGHEFTARVIEELAAMWSDCKVVQASPKEESKRSERINQDIENRLRKWMTFKKSTNWSFGCYFVQYQKNASLNRKIGKSPFKALFGADPKAGLRFSGIPSSVLSTIQTEEQLRNLLNDPLYSDLVPGLNSINELGSESSAHDVSDQSPATLDGIDNIRPLTCVVCRNEANGTDKCSCCNNAVHDQCGISDGETKVCFVCKSEQDIHFEPKEVGKGVKRAGDEVNNAVEKLLPLAVGCSVFVSVPDSDRGPLDTRTVKGKIVDHQNGVYQVGTKEGTIENWFPRTDLRVSFEEYSGNISSSLITLREAVTSQAILRGEGFQKCTCKPAPKQCRNNRCACFKRKVNCGSMCHSSFSCINK